MRSLRQVDSHEQVVVGRAQWPQEARAEVNPTCG